MMFLRCVRQDGLLTHADSAEVRVAIGSWSARATCVRHLERRGVERPRMLARTFVPLLRSGAVMYPPCPGRFDVDPASVGFLQARDDDDQCDARPSFVCSHIRADEKDAAMPRQSGLQRIRDKLRQTEKEWDYARGGVVGWCGSFPVVSPWRRP